MLLRDPDLKLNSAERRSIERLSSSEEGDEAVLLGRLRADQEQLLRVTGSRYSAGGASNSDLERLAQPVTRDSAELARIRKDDWDRAGALLTPKQRLQAERVPSVAAVILTRRQMFRAHRR